MTSQKYQFIKSKKSISIELINILKKHDMEIEPSMPCFYLLILKESLFLRI